MKVFSIQKVLFVPRHCATESSAAPPQAASRNRAAYLRSHAGTCVASRHGQPDAWGATSGGRLRHSDFQLGAAVPISTCSGYPISPVGRRHDTGSACVSQTCRVTQREPESMAFEVANGLLHLRAPGVDALGASTGAAVMMQRGGARPRGSVRVSILRATRSALARSTRSTTPKRTRYHRPNPYRLSPLCTHVAGQSHRTHLCQRRSGNTFRAHSADYPAVTDATANKRRNR